MATNLSDADTLYSESFTETGSIVNSTIIDEETGGSGGISTGSIVWMVFDGMIGALGMGGNGLVIYVFMRVITLRSLVNLFIINQSLIDFTTSLVFVLLHLGPKIQLEPGNKLDLIVCRIWVSEYVMWALFISSSINLMIITLERYFAIMMPQRYRQSVGSVKKRIVPFVFVIWLFGFIIDSYWAVIQEVTDTSIPYIPPGLCIPIWKSTALQGFVGVMIFFVTYLCPLSVMIFTYYQIIRQLHRQAKRTGTVRSTSVRSVSNAAHLIKRKKKSSARSDAKKNVIKTMLSVSTVYAICWGPIAFNYLVYNLGGPLDFDSTWYSVTKVFAYANMCANPFIYTMQYRQFQEGLRRIFGLKKDTEAFVDIDVEGNSQTASQRTNEHQLDD